MGLSFNQMKTALDLAVESGHVLNIVGLQGIGKTDLVKEYASERGYAFTEVTCSLLKEGDLAMPYISESASGGKEVEYAINKVILDIASKSKECEYAILFLDEFNRAPSVVQSELMNLVLQRKVVNFTLPPNVVLVLAMNPSSDMEGYGDTDYSVAYSDSAIMGRIVSVDMTPNLVDWLEYGSRVVNGMEKIHKVVRDYLSTNRDDFITKEKTGHINNTPRGWSRVSDIVYSYEKLGVNDTFILKNLLRGTIRGESAGTFLKFYKKNSGAIDYYNLAKKTLNAKSTDDWDSLLFKLNDVELDKVFKFMLDILKAVDVSENMLRNFKTYIRSNDLELAYSWVTLLERSYFELYHRVLLDEEFSGYILNILENSRSTEVGVFSGKV